MVHLHAFYCIQIGSCILKICSIYNDFVLENNVVNDYIIVMRNRKNIVADK